MSLGNDLLVSMINRLVNYKDLGDKTFTRLTDTDFHYSPNEETNSIAVTIQHMHGNMLSRWTDFLTSDGEKEWRRRDVEFSDQQFTKEQLVDLWEKGWTCFLTTLKSLDEQDLLKTIFIRAEGISVIDALNRQLAHYSYHTGQIIYIAKIIKNKNWVSLSVPRGESTIFNKKMRNKE